MLNAIAYIIGVLLIALSSASCAQGSGGQIPPHELRQVHEHCGKAAHFSFVRFRISFEDGKETLIDVITCLSSRDDQLVSITCEEGSQKCDVSRDRDEYTPAIEEFLRKLRRASPKSAT